jgi:hypothetical protein
MPPGDRSSIEITMIENCARSHPRRREQLGVMERTTGSADDLLHHVSRTGNRTPTLNHSVVSSNMLRSPRWGRSVPASRVRFLPVPQ